MFPLEIAAPPGASARSGRNRLRRGSRRIFHEPARGSRIGAWASKQSRPLESRFALEKAVAEYTARHAIGEIPRPDYWSGFRIRPLSIEFWHDRPFRLHDRVEFRRETPDGGWTKVRMYP